MELEHNFAEAYRIVFEALEKGNKIERMLKEISDMLNVSIILINPYGEITASVGEELIGSEDISLDNPSCFSIMNQYFSHERDYKKENLIRRMKQGVQIMNAIYLKENLEGFCITYHPKELNTERSIQLNQLICRAIAVRFRENGEIRHMDEPVIKQIISRNLLSSKNDTENTLSVHERIYRRYVVEPFVLAAMKTEEKGSGYGCKIQKKISEKFPKTLVYMENKEIRLLFVDVKSEKVQDDIYSELEEITKDMECISAVSMSFEDVEDIHTKCKILERILRIVSHKSKEERLYKEDEYYLELVCSYAYEKMGSKGYAYKQLNLLREEDNEKGTEFYQTLKAYLECGNNVNLAAKKLFIHRNTMVYRLSKIQEMIQMDVNDPEVSKRLLISIILGTFCSETK